MIIIIKNNKVVAKVDTTTILFVEKDKRTLKIVTETREFSYYEKLSNIESSLDDSFFPCRKGCYINMAKVMLMEDNCITFDNGVKYWLGRENFVRTKKAFYNFLNQDK